jgi:translation elongation factor EF-G
VICPALQAENPQYPEVIDEKTQGEWRELQRAVNLSSNKEGGPAVAYITKMQPFSSRLYDIVTRAVVKSEGPIRYVAFSKVFCGTLKRGQTVYAMGPKHGING